MRGRGTQIRWHGRAVIQGFELMKRFQQLFLFALFMMVMKSAGMAQLDRVTARIEGDF